MTDHQTSLEQRIAQGESETLEFKAQADPRRVAQVVVSFLNTSGGLLVIGVEDDGNVIGLSEPQRQRAKLASYLDAHIVPRAAWSVSVEAIGDATCLVIDAPPGSHLPYVVDGGIYIRRHTSSQPATREDLRELFSKGSAISERWERRLATGLMLDALDGSELSQTQRAWQDHLPSPEENQTVMKLLQHLHLVEGEQLLNSAAVLFANHPEHTLPQTQLKLVVFNDESGSEVQENVVLKGHAFSLFHEALAYLQRTLPTVSTMVGVIRTDRRVFSPFILREALLNALVHRDYATYYSNITIALHKDRLEIWNPGHLPDELTPQTITTGYVSLPRNPDIAYVFYLRGLMERLGLGARRIAQECQDQGLPPPTWKEIAGGVQLTLRFQKTRKVLEREESAPLNMRAVRLLERLQPGDVIDLHTYLTHHAQGVSERTARRDLEMLVARGSLRVKGKSRSTVYERVEPPTDTGHY